MACLDPVKTLLYPFEAIKNENQKQEETELEFR